MLNRRWSPARRAPLTAAVVEAYRRPCVTCGAQRDRRCKGLGDNEVHQARLGEPIGKRPTPERAQALLERSLAEDAEDGFDEAVSSDGR